MWTKVTAQGEVSRLNVQAEKSDENSIVRRKKQKFERCLR